MSRWDNLEACESSVPYAVELYFDPETEATVRALWRTLGEAGIDDTQQTLGFRPHISLAIARDVDANGLRERLSAWAERTTVVSLQLAAFGVFTGPKGVAFLAPAASRKLIDLHEDFHAQCGCCLTDAQPYYAPGAWVPHVTIAQHLAAARAGRVLSSAWDTALPIEGELREVGLSELTPTVLRYLFALNAG